MQRLLASARAALERARTAAEREAPKTPAVEARLATLPDDP